MDEQTANAHLNSLREINTQREALREHLMKRKAEIDAALALLGGPEPKTQSGRPKGSRNKPKPAAVA